MKSVVVAAALCVISSVDAFGITSRGYVVFWCIFTWGFGIGDSRGYPLDSWKDM